MNKRIAWAAAVAILGLSAALLASDWTMEREIKTDIVIDAPAETVWAHLVDLPRYEQWNPFIRSASGTIALNETITVTPDMGDGWVYQVKDMTFHPTIREFEPGRRFAWTGNHIHMAVFSDKHVFELQPLPDGRTRFVHNQHFFGLAGALVAAISGEDVRAGFSRMNHALKSRAEARDHHSLHQQPGEGHNDQY